jgi:mono/diheme cytochrome c family protein
VSARLNTLAILGAAMLCHGGCDNMQHQQNSRAGDPSPFFADGSSARVPPPHTIPHGTSPSFDPRLGGDHGGAWQTSFPLTVDRALIERGRDRYAIFCADCHGADGYGRGIVVLRGFPAPRSFHDAEVRAKPAGEMFESISRGSGIMYGFGDRIAPQDRWALVAFIRALQRSQNATLADVPALERERLGEP